MAVLSDLKQRRHQLGSSRSIRRLLERRWWVVVLALMLTGLGAALTGVLFKAGLKLLGGWRLELAQLQQRRVFVERLVRVGSSGLEAFRSNRCGPVCSVGFWGSSGGRLDVPDKVTKNQVTSLSIRS